MKFTNLTVAALLVAAPIAAFAEHHEHADMAAPAMMEKSDMMADMKADTMMDKVSGTEVSGTMMMDDAAMPEHGMMKKPMEETMGHDTMKKSSY